MRRLACSVLAFVVAVCLPACQKGPTIYHVKGTVSYQDQPLPAGVIFFDPDVTKGNDGPQGYAFIKDGAYDTAAKGGQGVVGGPHVVRIQGFDGKSGNDLPMGRVLFTDFQEAVDLPRQNATRDFKVPGK